MAAVPKKVRFQDNDKRTIAMEPTGKKAAKAFRKRLTDEESAALLALREIARALRTFPGCILDALPLGSQIGHREDCRAAKNHIEWRRE